MTRVLVDPVGLERTARVLDHVAEEYRGLASQLRASPSLPGPIGAWLVEELGRLAAGLGAQAETLGSIAGRLRERAREARLADAAGGQVGRGRLRPLRPHGPPPPPLAPQQPEPGSPEQFLLWLTGRLEVSPGPGRLGPTLGLASSAAKPAGSGAAAAVLGFLILVGALVGVVQMSGSRSEDSSRSRPESGPTAADTGARCTPQPPFDPDPVANYRAQLDPATLDAARRELRGEVVARKPDGTPYNHVGKVKDAQRGLKNTIAAMEKDLSSPGCSTAQRAQAQSVISEASRLLDYSEKYVPPGS